MNGEKKIAEWEANKEEREREKQAEEYLKKQAKANGAARLREVEEKEREAYHAESAKVSEGVEAAVANGLKEAAAIEAAKRKGKEIVVEEESDEDDDDDDFDDSALLFRGGEEEDENGRRRETRRCAGDVHRRGDFAVAFTDVRCSGAREREGARFIRV